MSTRASETLINHSFMFQILQGGGGPVTVNASLTNVTVVGFGDTKVALNKVDPVTYDFHTSLSLARMRIDGNYELLGRILVIPLRGKGSCWFDASKCLPGMGVKVDVDRRSAYRCFSRR